MPGEEARKVFSDAQTLLNNIVNNKLLQCQGVVGFFRAQSVGDDIELYDDNGAVIETLFGLRQQVSIDKDYKSWDGAVCHVKNCKVAFLI